MLRRWVVYWHGEGEAHQADLYRCEGCRRLVTWRMIRRGGDGCAVNRLRPVNPTRGEALALVLLPWRFA